MTSHPFNTQYITIKETKMNYYQVKVRLERVDVDGAIKATSEVFLVRAASFGQAEAAIMHEVASYATGGVDVVAIARKNYKEIVRATGADSDKWFKCKMNFSTINEKSGKEKKTAHLFLVKASSALTAHQTADEFMQSSMSAYAIEQVDETKIVEVMEVDVK